MKLRTIGTVLFAAAVLMSFCSCEKKQSATGTSAAFADETMEETQGLRLMAKLILEGLIKTPPYDSYIKSSRVTSANSTAASIRNNIDTFLNNAGTAGYGMLEGVNNNDILTITVTDGVWTVNMTNTGAFRNGNGKTWATGGTGTAAQSKVGVTNPASLLAIELACLFPEVETASILAYVEGGKNLGRALAVAYTADTSAPLVQGTDCPTITKGADDTEGGWTRNAFAWDNSTAGVSSSGLIVGTYPFVALG